MSKWKETKDHGKKKCVSVIGHIMHFGLVIIRHSHIYLFLGENI